MKKKLQDLKLFLLIIYIYVITNIWPWLRQTNLIVYRMDDDDNNENELRLI